MTHNPFVFLLSKESFQFWIKRSESNGQKHHSGRIYHLNKFILIISNYYTVGNNIRFNRLQNNKVDDIIVNGHIEISIFRT